MKVFLSSTAQDLVAYRKVADDTILRMSQEAVVMERFGPLPGEPVAECERKARESDVVVCIVAHRYGFVPDKGRGVSRGGTSSGPRHPEPRRRRRISKLQAFSHLEILRRALPTQDDDLCRGSPGMA